MDNKNMIIILVAVIAIIAVIGVVFTTGMLNGEEKNVETTPFETEFMEGAFVGNVSLVNDSEKFMHSYRDKNHNITYNISTVDDSDSLMAIYEIQGVTNPEERTFNDNDWNIYFTQAVPGNDSNANEDKTMNIVICQSQAKKQGYLIYMIIDSETDVNTTSFNTFGEAYNDYVVPLLESATLKKSKHVPKINEEFGLTEDQFAEQMNLIKEYKAGNTSALEGTG